MKKFTGFTRIAAVVLLLTAVAATALADTEVDQTRKVAKNVRLGIENISGEITITGWDKNEVRITGSLEKDIEELRITGDGDELQIEVVVPKNLHGRNQDIEADLNFRVPHGARLDVETVNSPILVDDVSGPAELATVNGRIVVEKGPERIVAATVNGRIEIASKTTKLKAETVNGGIKLAECRGEVSVSVVSGNVEMADAELEEFNFSAVSGDLELTGAMVGKADWDISLHSGRAVLRLPADTSAEFDISAFSGDIENEFGPAARRASKYGPGKELSFTAGDGDANFDADIFSGDLHLLKR